jgi:hypothetical protein
VPVNLPASSRQLGSPNHQAADAIAAALKSAGFSSPGLKVYVFLMKGLNESLLAIDIDPTQAETVLSGTNAETVFLKAIASSPVLERHRITRFVLTSSGSDAQGTYGLTITMPMTVVQGMANGTMTEAQAQSQIAIQITR